MPTLLPTTLTVSATLAQTSLSSLAPATAWYLVLYLATLVVHAVFMGYVLAGSAYLAMTMTLRPPDQRGPFEPLLREWLPFMLSLAITAGIAPLLFIQILYRPGFYTANLLLFHRWMAVLPVLIVGFYLLYLVKNRWSDSQSRLLGSVIAAVAACCFAFIAWSWTENHLLSLAGQQVWTEQYLSDSMLYRSAVLLPRLAMWFCGTFAILAVWLSWQIWWTRSADAPSSLPGTRQAAVMGLLGLGAMVACGLVYFQSMSAVERTALTSAQAYIPWGLTIAGAALMAVLLVKQVVTRELSVRRLTLLSITGVVWLAGGAVLRELIRLSKVDVDSLVEMHTSAARIGGLGVFLAFLVINGAIITWCIRRVMLSTSNESTESNAPLR